jgi:hypothetical protein
MCNLDTGHHFLRLLIRARLWIWARRGTRLHREYGQVTGVGDVIILLCGKG